MPSFEKRMGNLERTCAEMKVALFFAMVVMASPNRRPILNEEQASLIDRTYKDCLLRIKVSTNPQSEADRWVEDSLQSLGLPSDFSFLWT